MKKNINLSIKEYMEVLRDSYSTSNIEHLLETHQEDSFIEDVLNYARRISKKDKSAKPIHYFLTSFDVSIDEVKQWLTDYEDDEETYSNIQMVIDKYNKEKL